MKGGFQVQSSYPPKIHEELIQISNKFQQAKGISHYLKSL